MDKKLHLQIERLRGQMVNEAMLHNTMLHQKVLHLSQRLDMLIVRVQAEQLASRAGGEEEATRG
ncbi:aspartyl-phosphate phosphatase Spo0E family protein [Paenibacillus beijingensis]|uniref:Phosphatase n=1 Tax=Paenibacillus beijingensis TaxID=1126833 RepID=A0A0D5NQH2_9BACL|nr:aspartyl-phosphate phosphatase Spo0E family protein [Paenibacillus beijingensis]AJY77227.1 hypothetical protein VN24_25090 [Paenibacillus beijingensis]